MIDREKLGKMAPLFLALGIALAVLFCGVGA